MVSPEVRMNSSRKPLWLKVDLPQHPNYFAVSNLLRRKHLHTICTSAKCPNLSTCWSQKTATFLIMGDTCTRDCAFCAVNHGTPSPLSPSEPDDIAEAAAILGLRYAVITSVTRDDLPDGGAAHFTATIAAVRKKIPGIVVETLIPDFGGDPDALGTVLKTRPDVLNHNLEVPQALYSRIGRPTANYSRSLAVLKAAKQQNLPTKSGLMIGLGETDEEILQALADLRTVDCNLLTIGQYLQPNKSNPSVRKYYTPKEFDDLKSEALKLGFRDVQSGPLVRSSFRAHELYRSIKEQAD